MKKFPALLAVIVALCIGCFAQKKAAVDPCSSKDPKVRATSKKPCPSAPSPKKTKPTDPPNGTGDGETSNDNADENDPPANDKTKKPNSPQPKNKTPKNSEGDGTTFFVEIVHNGEKTELAYSQFEEHGGNATPGGGSRLLFFYGAGNSTMNDDDFMFTGMIPTAAKGTYAFGTAGVMFSFKADKFPNVPIFLCDSGSYDILAMPLSGGFVEGTFTANCVGEVHDDGSSEKYTMSGKFKLLRAG